MKEILIKSYDIIKEEQRNADSKAYIFIGLLTAVIGIFGKVPVNGLDVNSTQTVMQMLLLLLLPLLLLIISLIPRYDAKLFISTKDKNLKPMNLYYWKTLTQFIMLSDLIKSIEEKYKVKLNTDEIDLTSQIHSNVKIMSTKAAFHELAFSILYHISMFVFSAILFLTTGLLSIVWFFVIFVLLELLYWIISNLNNKNNV